ncbi:ATP-dependent DNA helicase [Actinotalea sp. Marseille-Q4924]|uniref:ATP-dependent helicase n=1 Tax=Actinotalea sp. Marseille-Q4924 TaxID=2866571 RepID=UPI001CE3CB90|nr:ATP-dependent DNA helicase [Actinotalea sp. Marseille-Q4924]
MDVVSVRCDGIVAVSLTLLPPPLAAPSPALDEVQRAVLEHRGPALLVRGAAGSGKTTTALALAVDRVSSGALAPEDVLLLAPTRRAAAHLRDQLSARLVRTTGQPVVRTAASAAFSVLRARAALLGEPPPALITGPEQDLVLADLLAGHAAGEGADVRWPPSVPAEALAVRAFRDELRDLLMRAAERGLRPEDLQRLGRKHDRPEWMAAATVYAEYMAVTRLRTGTPDVGSRFDPAVVVDEAAEALRAWESEVPGSPRPRWALVVVDDYQEATAATARLLHALVDDGSDLVLLADPDSAVQTFRGATPGLVDRASVGPVGGELGAFAAVELTLPVVRRHGSALRAAVGAVTRHIHGPDRVSRGASAADDAPPGEVRVALLRSPAQESAYVAYVLRSARLHEDLPWNRMAVVVRSGAQLGELRRALLGAQVPVTVVGSDLPLRSEPAVRPLLLAASCAVADEPPSAEDVAALLTSALGGLDSVGLRRLRRTLRAEEVAHGGGRASDALLTELVADGARVDALPAAVRRPVRRVIDVLASGAAAAQEPGATVLDVLWAVWETSGLAEPWRRTALAGGPGGARADRDLDAVLALFKAAEQFVDRLTQAPVTAFLEHLESQDLPADTLAAQGDTTQAVSLLTAAGAAGGEWDLVVVAGVQEGTWPDLRLRDSMLGAQKLVDVLAGRAVPGLQDAAAARTAVLDDELRAFAVAVSRATRRLVVTAVDDADHQPSAFVDLVDLAPEDDEDERDRHVTVPGSLDLRGAVARCRALLEAAAATGAPGPDDPAAALLARLAREEAPGAHPDEWVGARSDSTLAPLWEPGAIVTLSPSRLESVTTCALRWALEEAGGRPGQSGEQSLGTLLHEVAAAVPDGDAQRLREELDRLWPRLGLAEGWIAAAQHRRADRMLDHLGRYLRSGHEVVAVERDFRVDLGGVVLRGAVDRIERVGRAEDGTALVRVVDLKTGRSQATRADTERHAQLGAYQVAVDAGAFDDVVGEPARSAGAALVYVGTVNKNPAVKAQGALAEDARPRWADELIHEVATTVSGSVMAARENALCRVCPVRRSCPVHDEGRTVGA